MSNLAVALFATLSVILCHLSLYDAPGSLNADVLYPLSLSLEVMENITYWKHWDYSGYTGWFPDVVSIMALAQIFGRKYILFANVVWGLIQVGLLHLCSARLIHLITKGKSNAQCSLLASVAMLVFFFFSDRRLLGPALYPIHHFSAFLWTLMTVVLYFSLSRLKTLSTGTKTRYLLFFISIVAVTISDPFFLIFGSFPLAITHVFFRVFRASTTNTLKSPRKGLDLYTGLTVTSSVFGYGIYKLTPVSNDSYFESSLSASLDSIRSFSQQLVWSPQTLLIFLAVLAITYFSIFRWLDTTRSTSFYKKHLELDLDNQYLSFYVLFTFTSTLLSLLTAVGFYGLFDDVYHFRYFHPITFCPPVLMGLALAVFIRKLNLTNRFSRQQFRGLFWFSLAAIASLNIVFFITIEQGYSVQENRDIQNLECIQKLQLDYYAAEYWWAKPIHVLSAGKILPIQLNSNADYYAWVSSDRWYQALNQVDGKLGVLVQANGKQLIDPQQVINKTQAHIPQQCGELEYLLSEE